MLGETGYHARPAPDPILVPEAARSIASKSSSSSAYGIFASFTSTRSWYGRLEYFESDLGNYSCIDINCVY
jgi:hypothetical protein